MMYTSKFIACVRVNGKILRETDQGVVHLPWGSEYSLLLKNLNSVRSVVKVSVDGKEASGAGLIIPANGSVDLERFIANGNLDRGNKFKFIERTAGIEAHKGIGSEDGLVRVEFTAEKVIHKQTVVTEHIHHHNPSSWPWRGYSYGINTLGGLQNVNVGAQADPFNMSESLLGGSSAQASGISGQSRIVRSMAMNSVQASINDVGITVAGSESNQRFSIGENFPLEIASHVIVLQLRGVVGDKKVVKAVTVKSKRKCTSCGFQGKSSQTFCSKCGTALEII